MRDYILIQNLQYDKDSGEFRVGSTSYQAKNVEVHQGTGSAIKEAVHENYSKIGVIQKQLFKPVDTKEYLLVNLGKKSLLFNLNTKSAKERGLELKKLHDFHSDTSDNKLNTKSGVLVLDVEAKTVKFDGESQGHSIEGAQVMVGTQGEIEERITATRMLAVGLFAFAFKKKTDNRQLYIVIAGPDVNIQALLSPNLQVEANSFALKIENLLGQPTTNQEVDKGPDPIAQIERLAELKEKGILSESEFNAKKSELLGML